MDTALSRDGILATAGALLLVGIVVAGGLLWASFGGGSRDLLVTQMLVNVILVMALQIFIGNTGILSFGHLGFAAVSGYTLAVLTIPVEYKQALIPDAPWGLATVELSVGPALLVAVGVTLLVGLLVGVAVVRVGGIAATMITLALLFGTHEVALNWIELTDGGGGLSFIPRLGGRVELVVVVVIAVVGARWFRRSRTGRWAQAAREDPLAASAVGISSFWPWLAAFLLSVVLTAVAASMRVQVLGSISPLFFYFELTLVTLTMLIVGGRRSVTGAMVGVVVITAGSELTRVLASGEFAAAGLGWLLRPGLSDLFLGGAMVGFMLLRPEGLLGDWELDDWLARRLGRGAGRPAEPEPDTAGAAPLDGSAGRLEAAGVTVDFGGFRALDDVTLSAGRDEVVGLIGPNGAGKTTLLNVVTGVVEPTAGRVRLDGRELTGARTVEIARAGLARTFQNLRLFRRLSVAENVAVASLAGHRYRDAEGDLAALLDDAGLWADRDRPADTLDYGSQRGLELARAAATGPAFLLLDEPTSGMGRGESIAMVDHVRETAARLGAGVVVIDHDLQFITRVCDRIYVLDHGAVIATGTPDEIQRDPAVRRAYLGSEAAPQQAAPRDGGAGPTPDRVD